MKYRVFPIEGHQKQIVVFQVIIHNKVQKIENLTHVLNITKIISNFITSSK